ncbi:7 TM domain-containing transmembrane protein [Acrasis kona]|uniref:7 TM domain-containing transmembrane protein n=1 Tax=Acrasis kona TaxID=1008807 RepID=A0AAW2ZF78_9EUKA
MKPTTFLFLAIVIFTCRAKVTTSIVSARDLHSFKFVYLDKFCFDTNLEVGTDRTGSLSWKILDSNLTRVHNLNVNLYFGSHWSDLLSVNDISCNNIRNFSVSVVPLNQQDYTTIVQEKNYHFWYLLLDACDFEAPSPDEDYLIEIKFHWKNVEGYFKEEFSFERQGLFETLIFIVPVVLIIYAFAVYNVIRLLISKVLHLMVRIYFASLCLFVIHVTTLLAHFAAYGKNGHGVGILNDSSLAIRLIAELLFIALLFSISSGWLITQTYIRHLNVLSALLVTLAFLYTFLFVWVEIGIYTETDAEYIFETTPGIVISILRLVALGIFIYSLVTTMKKEFDAKKLFFYKVFGILFAPWFVILPVTVIINFAVPFYVRTKVTEGITLNVEIIYYAIMLGMLWHTRLCELFKVNTKNSEGLFNVGSQNEQVYEDL